MSDFKKGHFSGGDRHALFVGWVVGIAMRRGVDVQVVVDDDGNYTDRLIVPIGDLGLTVIVPPPPDDWEFPHE